MATGRRNFTMTDDDIYTEDDNLDAVLMTAPDAATVAYAGEVSLRWRLRLAARGRVDHGPSGAGATLSLPWAPERRGRAHLGPIGSAEVIGRT